MKYCTNCGTELLDSDVFCTNCGFLAPQSQSQTENVNSTKISKLKTKLLNYKTAIITIAIVLLVSLVTVICLKLIPYKSFNIKDEELIEILNNSGSYTSQSSLELDDFDPDTTIYQITCEGETGLLVLSHGFSGHIRCIMVCFEDNDVYAAAIISAIASELDYSFSTNKSMNSLLLEGENYSSNEYTALTKELSSDLTGVFLAPNEHVKYCVKSILDN